MYRDNRRGSVSTQQTEQTERFEIEESTEFLPAVDNSSSHIMEDLEYQVYLHSISSSHTTVDLEYQVSVVGSNSELFHGGWGRGGVSVRDSVILMRVRCMSEEIQDKQTTINAAQRAGRAKATGRGLKVVLPILAYYPIWLCVFQALEGLKTRLHAPATNTHFSYNRVPWRLKIRLATQYSTRLY